MPPVDLTLPLYVVSRETLPGRRLSIRALTGYGRLISAVIEWPETTVEGIDRALHRAWLQQLFADSERECALVSMAADWSEGYALDDSHFDPGVG